MPTDPPPQFRCGRRGTPSLAAAAAALIAIAMCATGCATSSSETDTGVGGRLSAFADIAYHRTTRAQVRQMLGKPDQGEDSGVVWRYGYTRDQQHACEMFFLWSARHEEHEPGSLTIEFECGPVPGEQDLVAKVARW